MLKLIRGSGIITAFLCFLLAINYINYDQFNKPLGTDASFHLAITDSQLKKEKIISELNDIADKNETYFLLPSSNSKERKKKRDLYVFGKKEIDTTLMTTEDENLHWLFNNLEGQILSFSNISETPISGIYHVVHNPNIESSLEQWANRTGVSITYYKPLSLQSIVFTQLGQNGALLGWITSILLIISLSLAWIVFRNKTRCIQLVSGKTLTSIHLETVKNIFKYFISGFLVGTILSLVYLYYTITTKNILLVLKTTLAIMLFSSIIILVSVVLFSILFKPSRKLISERSFPSKKYYSANAIISIISILLAILTLAPSISLISNSFRNYNQAKELQVFDNAVSVSFNESNIIETNTGLTEFQRILKKQQKDSLILNLDLGSVIELTDEELGGYSKIIIVNDNFLSKIGITQQELNEIKLSNLPVESKNFLKNQLTVSSKKDVEIEKSFMFYEYKGNGIMALSQNAFLGGEISYPDSALIVLAKNPLEDFDTLGFLFPITSTGNLFFNNAYSIKNDLEQSTIYENILSIDSVTNSSIIASQSFALNGFQFLVASIIIVFMIGFVARQNVKVWTRINRKRNFVFITNGELVFNLYKEKLNRSILSSIFVVLFGSIVTKIFGKYTDTTIVILAALVIEIVYIFVILITYKSGTKKEFRSVALREE